MAVMRPPWVRTCKVLRPLPCMWSRPFSLSLSTLFPPFLLPQINLLNWERTFNQSHINVQDWTHLLQTCSSFSISYTWTNPYREKQNPPSRTTAIYQSTFWDTVVQLGTNLPLKLYFSILCMSLSQVFQMPYWNHIALLLFYTELSQGAWDQWFKERRQLEKMKCSK